jgi:hypothetical protein
MGGRSEVPVIQYVQNPNGTFSAETSKGTIQNVPLVWQQGCPPSHGSGCPVGAISVQPGKNVSAKRKG